MLLKPEWKVGGAFHIVGIAILFQGYKCISKLQSAILNVISQMTEFRCKTYGISTQFPY